MDPSGTFVQFEAKAIGSGSEGAQQSLQEVYHKVIEMFSNCKISILTNVNFMYKLFSHKVCQIKFGIYIGHK